MTMRYDSMTRSRSTPASVAKHGKQRFSLGNGNAATGIIEVTRLGLRNSSNMAVKGSMPTRRRASLDVSVDLSALLGAVRDVVWLTKTCLRT
ncbi:uncharacterized protein TrAtP1_008563 [Trichoderma atroviride]|uniref:uncharacterized protein n=1 Tax=Hypocrea atroviridis TaxID=63577 RepID=UPI003325DD93|nr:hypothetical protein TrAtP1_008563 [Trichoderma atroviride]